MGGLEGIAQCSLPMPFVILAHKNLAHIIITLFTFCMEIIEGLRKGWSHEMRSLGSLSDCMEQSSPDGNEQRTDPRWVKPER